MCPYFVSSSCEGSGGQEDAQTSLSICFSLMREVLNSYVLAYLKKIIQLQAKETNLSFCFSLSLWRMVVVFCVSDFVCYHGFCLIQHPRYNVVRVVCYCVKYIVCKVLKDSNCYIFACE